MAQWFLVKRNGVVLLGAGGGENCWGCEAQYCLALRKAEGCSWLAWLEVELAESSGSGAVDCSGAVECSGAVDCSGAAGLAVKLSSDSEVAGSLAWGGTTVAGSS